MVTSWSSRSFPRFRLSMGMTHSRRLSLTLLCALLCMGWALPCAATRTASEDPPMDVLAVRPDSIEMVLKSGEAAAVSLQITSPSMGDEGYVLEGIEVDPESNSSPPAILLCHAGDLDGPVPEALPAALEALGWPFAVSPRCNAARLKAELSHGEPWDLVVVLSSRPFPSPAIRVLLHDFVADGGQLIWARASLPEDSRIRLLLRAKQGKKSLDGPGDRLWDAYPPAAFTESSCVAPLGNGATAVVTHDGRMVFLDGVPESPTSGDGSREEHTLGDLELWKGLLLETVSRDIPWLRWDTAEMTADKQGFGDVLLTLDASLLAPGEYRAQLKIRGNDPCRRATVPVSLSVGAATLPMLDLGVAEGFPGETVTVPITLRMSRGLIAATENDIGFSPDLLENPSAKIGPAGSAAGKTVLQRVVSDDLFRVGVFNINRNVIQDGTVAYVSFTIRWGAPAGMVTLYNSPSASSGLGAEIQVQGSNGTLRIKPQHVVQAGAEGGGTINPSGNVLVNEGFQQSFSIAPSDGYHVADVRVDGQSVGPVTDYSFSAVKESHSITAFFEINRYTIAASAGENGTVDPAGDLVVQHGGEAAFMFRPASCHHVADVLVDGVSVGQHPSYSFRGVTGDHTLRVVFASDTFRINASAGPHGRIEPSGPVWADCGQNVSFTFRPDEGYRVGSVKVDGGSVGAPEIYGFFNLRQVHRLRVSFERIHFPIIASAASGGEILPSGRVSVGMGRTQVFRIVSNPGYRVHDVWVDGKNVGAVKRFGFSEVDRPHSIYARFSPDHGLR